MKKLFLVLNLIIISLMIQAQEINIHKTDGSVITIALSNIDSISFSQPSLNLPVLTTNAITDITETSAISGGNITSDGGETIIERGICYSESQYPTISDLTVVFGGLGSNLGSYSCNLTGLTLNKTYYVRAYATNNAGTSYGNQLSFTTLGNSGATILSFTGKTLNYFNTNQTGYDSSTPFLDLDNDEVTVNGTTAINENIDIVLCAQSTLGSFLGSPDSWEIEMLFNINYSSGYTSIGKHNTNLQKIIIDFNSITVEYLSNLTVTSSYIGGTSGNGQGVTNIQVGDIIAFETYDSVKGILKVISSTNSYGGKGTASMVVDVKILSL